MSDKQRTFGQFETPVDVADLLLGFCLRRPDDRLLDPSCGAGALLERAQSWQSWMAGQPDFGRNLWGVELDPETAVSAHQNLPHATIRTQNFFTLDPDSLPPFDAIVGNPPYTRAEWIGRLHRQSGEQLTFGWDTEHEDPSATTDRQAKQPLIPHHLWRHLSHRSGLHAYFFLHGVHFLREGGRFGFVVPNAWLDVAYGADLKQFLLDRFRLIALIESGVERWFKQARVNTCLIILEKCSDADRRAANLVRMIRLQRPLSNLISRPPDDRQRPLAVERLVPRLLPSANRQTGDFSVRVLPQWEMDANAKWGLLLRAPDVYRQRLAADSLPLLKSWTAIRRGYTTGANQFFYLEPETIAEWEIEPRFRRPLLKTLRGVDRLRLGPADCQTEILLVPPDADLTGTAVSRYIAWGEAQEFHRRRTCAARQPWYALPPQEPAQLVLPKGIWRRHTAPLLTTEMLIDQQLYRLALPPGISPTVAAALLNSAWFMLQCELQGRINFGAGLLWLAAYELGATRLPDPRHLPPEAISTLEDRFAALAQRPIRPIDEELQQPDRQALDTAVFDLLAFSAAERTAVLDALQERLLTRQRRAAAQPT